MIKREYYYIVAGLPDLFFNENKLIFSSLKFRNEIKTALTKTDQKLVEYIFMPFDNENMLNFLFQKEEKYNCHAIYSKAQITGETENQPNFPEYLKEFLREYYKLDNKSYSVESENRLYQLFYNEVFLLKNDFLTNWFEFELSIKNILTAFNCSRFGYPTKKHLIKAQRGINTYNLLTKLRFKPELFQEELPFAEQIFRTAETSTNLLEKEKSIDKIKWEYLDEATFFHYFTIEKIISYILKLFMVERWIKLDAETGKALLEKLVSDIELNYEFSNEYNV